MTKKETKLETKKTNGVLLAIKLDDDLNKEVSMFKAVNELDSKKKAVVEILYRYFKLNKKEDEK